MRIPMAAFFGSGDVRIIAIAVVLALLVSGVGAVHAQTRTDEFDVVMEAAIATGGAQTATSPAALRTAILDNDGTTPLVLDMRPGYEYATGHINGSINIYYRHLGKSDALEYLNSSLEAHIGAGKKNEIVVYGNTRHLSRMVATYLKTQGYTVNALRKGFSEWTSDAPGRFIECTGFDANGTGTSPANCTSSNFPTTTANQTDAAAQSGEGYPTNSNIDCIAGTATSADLAEIASCMYDWRFGNMSKPAFKITAAELYDMLDDNQDGAINGSDDTSNDPYVLSNRGTTWSSPYPDGPYYTDGHIPGAIAVDQASDAEGRLELKTLNNTDFLPTDKTIVHHCWVGVSQQFGAMWYNLLGYTVQSLDWGIQGWTTNAAVRGTGDIVVTPLNYAYEIGDNQTPYVVLKSPSGNVATTTVTFSVFVLEGGSPNVTLWGNWSGWGIKDYNDTAEDITDYEFTVANFSIGTMWKWGVNVTDEYNNSNWTANWTFNIIADVVPPNVTISLPANGSYVSNSTPTLIAAMVEDNPDTMWYSVDGGANITGCVSCTPKTFEVTLNNLSEDLHNVTVYANDSGGLESSNISFFTVDTLDPTQPALISPANNTLTADATPDLTWSSVNDTNFANYTIEVDNSNAFDSIDYTYSTTNKSETNYSVTTTAWAEDTWYWRVVAWDMAGNSNESDYYILPLGYVNSSVNITANETVTIDALNETGTILEIATSGNVTGGSITIKRRIQAPANQLNITNGLGSDEYSVEKFITINVSDNIRGNISWVKLRSYYNTSDLDRNGGDIGTGDINENTLSLYWYDSANGTWRPLTTGANYTEYGGPYVINAGVTTTPGSGYLGYVWANVTNFSVYGVGGSLIPAPPAPTGGGSPPPKTIFARAVLTTSEDWRYAMMAAGFAAANDYILITVPTHSIDLPTRNNLRWFDELIIVGDSFVISDGMEDEFIKLRRTLVPGFAKLNTTRVEGANFFGTAVQLVKRWKDPKGIIVVRGDVFADALVAGQLSAVTDSPILYTMPGEIWPPALYTIKRLKLDVTIVGGEKAVSKNVEDAIRAAGVNVRRVGGKDRYETAALIGDEYINAAKEKGKEIDTITFLSGKKGEWANTLGFRSYVYNSAILYIEEVEGQSAVPTPTKNFIAAHPYISSASIVINNGAKPKGYEDVDAYIKDMEFDVDPTVRTFIMDVDPDKKDYTLDTSTGGLSTMVSQIVIKSLGASGVLSGPSGAGGGDGDGDGGGQ